MPMFAKVTSSNVNEVIRTILNSFFYEKILHAQKAQNAYKQTKIKKTAFVRTKRKKAACLYA